jgi:UDP-glucose 4-epimerase
VLVTGGAGFIGVNLVRTLRARGHGVTVLDDMSAGRREFLEGLDVGLVEGDVRDPRAVDAAVRGHHAIVHLAAQTGVPTSLADPRHDCEVNVLGTLNVLEAVRRRGNGRSPRVVFASSNAPLGRQVPPAREDKAPLPVSPYGASKLAAEAYCLAYHGSWGVPTVALRFANVYGPYSDHKQSVVARFFATVRAGAALTVDGDGEQTRDFIFVGDLCRAIVLALESDVAGEVLQVATGVETSIRQLADMVADVVGRPVPLVNGAPRAGDVRKNYSDIGKVQRLLGWTPQVDLRQGLRSTWSWWQAWQDAREGNGAGVPPAREPSGARAR